MKFPYAILAALLLAEASAIYFACYNELDGKNDLDHDLDDFCKLLSKEKLNNLVLKFLSNDGFIDGINYIITADFHKLMYALEESPEFQRYALYLQMAGYNIVRELRYAHLFLQMKDLVPLEAKSPKNVTNFKKNGDFTDFFVDLIAILPKAEIQALHNKKLKESSPFAKFHKAVTSPRFFEITMALHFQEPMLNLIKETRAHGFDLQKYYNFRTQLIGFGG